MEKGISTFIRESFSINEADIKTYSPLTLAYIGDAIFDLIIRTAIVSNGNTNANNLHKSASSIVKAGTQSEMIEKMIPHLTEEEAGVYKRGRNAKSHTAAKNASIGDYRRATGLEALIGYLYLQDKMDRIMELVKIGLEDMEVPWDTKN